MIIILYDSVDGIITVRSENMNENKSMRLYLHSIIAIGHFDGEKIVKKKSSTCLSEANERKNWIFRCHWVQSINDKQLTTLSATKIVLMINRIEFVSIEESSSVFLSFHSNALLLLHLFSFRIHGKCKEKEKKNPIDNDSCGLSKH